MRGAPRSRRDASQRQARNAAPVASGWTHIRPLAQRDLQAVSRIDAHHTGTVKRAYWRHIFREFLEAPAGRGRVGLAADGPSGLVGYLLGEVRAFEFGSDPCGWIFAIGVEATVLRHGVGAALVREASARFRAAGVTKVRTMVRRNDVPVLAFFRAGGFTGGPFVQLEADVTDEP